MSLRQLSTEACKDGLTCPGVWVDDEVPEDVIVVGKVMPSGVVPLGQGEVAVRLRRQTIVAAGLG
ncbi:MAG: hypothetical protein ABIQ18_30505 [Umezawaea sp.]